MGIWNRDLRYGEGGDQMTDLGTSWKKVLEEELEKPYFLELMRNLEQKYEEEIIYPAKEEIFRAFHLTPYEKVKVVILGQDPYHGRDQAEGLAFSVKRGQRIPPSLVNIYKELESDLKMKRPDHGSLTAWAEEGVLLLNAVLTVKEGEANSHRKTGWETFTDEVIRVLGKRKDPVVFILWGNHAKEKEKLIPLHHRIISSAHPSPLSANRGFFGSKPFSKANAYLEEMGKTPVRWDIL